MMIVPLVFITVIAHFPIGLVIYWVTTNLDGRPGPVTPADAETPAPSLFNRAARQKPKPKPAAKAAPAPAVARPRRRPRLEAAVPAASGPEEEAGRLRR